MTGRTRPREGEDWLIRVLLVLFLLMGAALRLWRFGAVPEGLNQDEAFAAYEAWCLLKTGRDSFGHSLPVYLTAWGSGMNALESYLMIPCLALLGRTTLAVRLPQLVVSLLSLPAAYGVGKRMADKWAGLCGLFLLAVCPWHVMLSRWGLESNLAPGFLLFGLFYFGALPLALVGLVWAVRETVEGLSRRELRPGAFLLIQLLAGILQGLTLDANVNRVNTLWIPVVLLAALGTRWLCGFDLRALLAPLLIFGALSLRFAGYYFTDYAQQSRAHFGAGLEQAVEAALAREGEIRVARGPTTPGCCLTAARIRRSTGRR